MSTAQGTARGSMATESLPPQTATAPGAEIRRHELAAFLRSRRERISPEQVGLPRGARRRTPGLRREEVAQLSAVGVTWYTWLEQARPIKVSEQVLDAVARTLLLDPSERAHLFQLAGATDPAPTVGCPTITPPLRDLLRHLDPVPACIQNSRYDILAYNRAYGRLMGDLDAVPPENRNCILLTHTDPAWRAATVGLDEVMRLMAARLRAAMAGHLTEPAWRTLIARLQRESEDFRRNWARYEVLTTRRTTKQILNPHVGLLNLHHTDLWLTPEFGTRMVTYAPVDEEARGRLERLASVG